MKPSMKIDHDSKHPSSATPTPVRGGPTLAYEPTIDVTASLKNGKGAKVRGNA